MGRGTFFKVGVTSARQKIYGKYLWFELGTATSQALKMASLTFVSIKQFYAMFYKPSTTPIYRTPYLPTPH